MKISLALACLLLAACSDSHIRLTPAEIKQRAVDCESYGLVPQDLVTMGGYVYDVVCRVRGKPQ